MTNPIYSHRRHSSDSTAELHEIATTAAKFQSLAIITSRTPTPEPLYEGTPSKEDAPHHTIFCAIPCALTSACEALATAFFKLFEREPIRNCNKF